MHFLSKLPPEGLVFVYGDADENIYIAQPLHDNDWARGSTSKFRACHFFSIDGIFFQSGFQGMNFCVITNKEYYDLTYPTFSSKNDPHRHEFLLQELQKIEENWLSPEYMDEFEICEDALMEF